MPNRSNLARKTIITVDRPVRQPNPIQKFGCARYEMHSQTVLGHAPVTNFDGRLHLYYYRSGVRKDLSAKIEQFLAGAPNSPPIIASIFLRLHLTNPRPLCDRFLRLSFVFLRKKS